jgi:hypothetical protein
MDKDFGHLKGRPATETDVSLISDSVLIWNERLFA